MRTAYRNALEEFSRDLIDLSDIVQKIMSLASESLLDTSLSAAENAVSQTDKLDEIRHRCEAKAVDLLALEGPVASELRQVVSSIYIVEDLTRMGALAMHIAKSARRRHPESVLPEESVEDFRRLAALVDSMAKQTHEVLKDPDKDIALSMERDDDEVDHIHSKVMAEVSSTEWKHDSRSAVDAALLGRFYERYADHCVNVAGRIVFLITGSLPGDNFTTERELDLSAEE